MLLLCVCLTPIDNAQPTTPLKFFLGSKAFERQERVFGGERVRSAHPSLPPRPHRWCRGRGSRRKYRPRQNDLVWAAVPRVLTGTRRGLLDPRRWPRSAAFRQDVVGRGDKEAGIDSTKVGRERAEGDCDTGPRYPAAFWCSRREYRRVLAVGLNNARLSLLLLLLLLVGCGSGVSPVPR